MNKDGQIKGIDYDKYSVEQFYLKSDGPFPNSQLPVLFYKGVFNLPPLFAGAFIKKHFKKNGWGNAWRAGIFEYQHYHSITHEVLGACGGRTTLLLGGDNGIKIFFEKGDVLIIPAGVAHKNLEKENSVTCIGAYYGDADYDMNYGREGERPGTDRNIHKVLKPGQDPVFGIRGGLIKYW